MIKIIIGLIIAAVVLYLTFVIAGTLWTTFGVFSAIGFAIKALHSIWSGEAISEPRVILLLFGFSIISGVVGTIFFQTFLPEILKGNWLNGIIILFVIALIYFGFKEKLIEGWSNRR